MAKPVIDISAYQHSRDIDYDTLSAAISGAILRVGFTGYGTGNSYYKDDEFENHYRELKKRGVPIGAYWYSCADTVAEGTAEANACYEVGLKGKTFELPIYWDTEDNHHQRPASSETLTTTGRAFCKRLEALGYYVGIYASSSWLYTELNMAALADIDVWVAHYGVSKPSYTGAYGMWQYTSTGRIPGYNGVLDLNVMYQDYPTIIKKAGLNGFSKTSQRDLQAKPAPKPQPKPQTTPDVAGTRFDKFESATFVFGTATNVRTLPSTTSSIVAVYRAGESVKYDRVYVGNGYVWISYIGGSGIRRYCAVRTYQNGVRGVAWGTFH